VPLKEDAQTFDFHLSCSLPVRAACPCGLRALLLSVLHACMLAGKWTGD
jgi:hypothetical protein